MWKKLAAVALGTGVGALLAVGTAEVWGVWHGPHGPVTAAERTQLQHLLDDNPNAIFMFDPATSFRYKPGFHGYRLRPAHLGAKNRIDYPHVTNSLGLIGADEVSADPARAKVLLLGDSVAYGVWIDGNDAFPARLQQLAGPAYQLLLAACEGWSTKQEIAFYDSHLRGIDWREILIVFALNDLVDFEWTFDTPTRPRLTEEILSVGNGGTRTNQTIGGLKLAARKRQFASDPKTAPLAGQTNTVLWSWEDDRWDRYLAQTLTPFVERKDHPRVSIVMAPTEGQLRALALGAPATAVLHPQLRLNAFCEREGMTCIDLVEAFAGTAPEQLGSMYLDDLHFSEAGHAAVAAYLWPRIKDLLDRPRGGS
jgi:GDSL-like lipase/acylhydrolase family protein